MTATTDPTLIVITLFRHAAVAAGCYLAVVTLVGAVARVVRLRGIAARAVDRVTFPALRRLLDASLGASLVATAVGSAPAWGEPVPVEDHPPPTMVRLPQAEDPPEALSPLARPPSSTTSTSATVSTTTEPPVTTTVVPPTTTTIAPLPTTTTTSTSASTSTPTTTAPARAPAAARVSTPPPPSVPPGGEWTVAVGDHFWSIAERVLTAAWQRAPSDVETDPYWRLLVEANRDRLADRDNPDLLFAGQVLVVPTPAPP